MKKTVKFLLTSILAFTSLGLVSVNIKDVKKGFVESTNDVAGEKINVGKKNAISTNTEEDFVVGKSVRITNAVAQRREETKGTTIRFVAAAKAENLTEGVIGGDLGFHVRYNRSETEVVNKYVAVESVYKSMVAGDKTYTNDKMGDFLVSTGLGEASNPNGYDVFITYSISEIPSTHLNTEFEVQPFFMKTGGETREFAPGTKKANATGYTLKVGDGNAVSLESCEKGDSNQTAQYKASITATAGDVVTFYVDGVKLTSNIDLGTGDNTSNNVLDNKNGNFEIRTAIKNQDVYLKQYGEGESAWYNVWVQGYVAPDPVDPVVNKVSFTVTVSASGWDPVQGNEVYYLWIWGGDYGGGQWVRCSNQDNNSNVVTFKDISSNASAFNVVRIDGSKDGSPSWDAKWNQSSDFTFSKDLTSYNVTVS